MRWFARAVDVDIGTLSALTVECKRCGRRVAVDGRLPKPGIRCPGCGFTFRISPNSRRASSGLVAAPAGEKTSAPPAWPSRVVELKRHPREEPSPGPPPVEKRPQSTGKAASNRSQAAWLTDESFVVAAKNFEEAKTETNRHWYLLGSELAMYVNWQLVTWIGIAAGQQIDDPQSWGLDFAMVVTFIGMLLPMIKDRPTLAAALVAGGAALLAHGLPNQLGLLLAALAGIGAGVLAERRWPAVVQG